MRALLQLADDRVERRARRLRVDAAQRVVGAEFEDHRVGAVAAPTSRAARARPPRCRPRRRRSRSSTAMPLAFSAVSSLAGKRLARRKPEAGGQRIAERHDPDRTLRRGAAARPASRQQRKHATRQSPQRVWTGSPGFPYDRHGPDRNGRRQDRMNDTSRCAAPGDRAVRRQPVARPRRGARAYPQRHRPAYRQRRGGRPGRPVRLGQIDAADGDGRARAAGHRHGRTSPGRISARSTRTRSRASAAAMSASCSSPST